MPRFVSAAVCHSGNGVFNVVITDIDGMNNIALFAVNEETAQDWLLCVNTDAASVSREEYLQFALENCDGDDTCRVDETPCECPSRNVDRCGFRRFTRAIRRCGEEVTG